MKLGIGIGLPFYRGSAVAGALAPPANVSIPVISGTVSVGSTLSTTDGSWSGTAPITFTYQWKANGTNIAGATANTYLLTSTELTKTITVDVSATNSVGGPIVATSAATSAVIDPPANTVAPAITGALSIGSVLTCSQGTWTGTATITYTYAWLKDGVLTGATGNTYTLVTGDIGGMMSCTVQASNGINTSVTTASVGPVIAVSAFTPASLFTGGEQGFWYDYSDFSTMFQDSTVQIPVTAVEQPVGYVFDKKTGMPTLGAEGCTNGTFDTDIAGWSSFGSGILAWSAGTMRVEAIGGTSGSGAAQSTAISTLNRPWIMVQFDIVELFPGAQAFVDVMNGGTTNITSSGYISSTGTYRYFGKASPGGSNVVIIRLYVRRAAGNASAGDYYRIDNFSVKTWGNGNNAYQNTAAARPVLSARVNLITKTEKFDDAAWIKTGLLAFGAGSVANTGATLDPMGGNNADLIVQSTANSGHSVNQPASPNITGGFNYKASGYIKYAGAQYVQLTMASTNYGVTQYATFDLINGTISGSAACTPTIVSAGNGWYYVTFTVLATSNGTGDLFVFFSNAATGRAPTFVGDGVSGVYLWGFDYRQAGEGVNVPAYQMVDTSTVYDTTGFPYYLKTDGVDDWMVTSANVDLSASDKVSNFAGLRKLADSVGMLAELSATAVSNTGTFYLVAGPDSGAQGTTLNGYTSLGRGSAAAANALTGQFAPFVAPDNAVLTAIHDIAGDLSSLDRNGVAGTSGTGDKGTGNFANAQNMYFFRRGGTTLPLNARIHQLVTLGRLATAQEILDTRAYINAKMRA